MLNRRVEAVRIPRLLLSCYGLLLMFALSSAHGTIIMGSYEGSVSLIDGNTPSGIQIGDRVIGRLQYDSSIPNLTQTEPTRAFYFDTTYGRNSIEIGPKLWDASQTTVFVQRESWGTSFGGGALGNFSSFPGLSGGFSGFSFSITDQTSGPPDVVGSFALPKSIDQINLAAATLASGGIRTGSGADFYNIQFSINPDTFRLGPTTPPLVVAEKSVVLTDRSWFNPGDGKSYHPSFNLSAGDGKVKVNLDLQLIGASPGILRSIWETGIEAAWNGKYDIMDGANRYPLSFDVNFVESGQDFSIEVIDGNGRSNAFQWYTDISAAGYTLDFQPLVAAHEFGHLFGLRDEYCNSEPILKRPVSDLCIWTGISFQNSVHNIMSEIHLDPAAHHFDEILNGLQIELGRTFSVDLSPDFIPNVIRFGLSPTGLESISHLESAMNFATIPTPTTLALVALGLAGLRLTTRNRSPQQAVRAKLDLLWMRCSAIA